MIFVFFAPGCHWSIKIVFTWGAILFFFLGELRDENLKRSWKA